MLWTILTIVCAGIVLQVGIAILILKRRDMQDGFSRFYARVLRAYYRKDV